MSESQDKSVEDAFGGAYWDTVETLGNRKDSAAELQTWADSTPPLTSNAFTCNGGGSEMDPTGVRVRRGDQAAGGLAASQEVAEIPPEDFPVQIGSVRVVAEMRQQTAQAADMLHTPPDLRG